MNYFERKRFMKAAWLQAFTNAGPVPRRRRPDEPITDSELSAMCLFRADVTPEPETLAPPATIIPPPPDTEPDAVPANLALLLGYQPVD